MEMFSACILALMSCIFWIDNCCWPVSLSVVCIIHCNTVFKQEDAELNHTHTYGCWWAFLIMVVLISDLRSLEMLVLKNLNDSTLLTAWWLISMVWRGGRFLRKSPSLLFCVCVWLYWAASFCPKGSERNLSCIQWCSLRNFPPAKGMMTSATESYSLYLLSSKTGFRRLETLVRGCNKNLEYLKTVKRINSCQAHWGLFFARLPNSSSTSRIDLAPRTSKQTHSPI